MFSKNLQRLIKLMKKEGYDAYEIICNPGRLSYYNFATDESFYFPHMRTFNTQAEIKQFIKDCRHNSRF